jgi:hypothetical protein
MARQYAINGLAGLKGGVVTHVGGTVVPPGTEFYRGLDRFTVTYWYYPTAVDIAAGATPGKRISVEISKISVNATDQQIVSAIMKRRAQVRASKSWGYPEAVAFSEL